MLFNVHSLVRRYGENNIAGFTMALLLNISGKITQSPQTKDKQQLVLCLIFAVLLLFNLGAYLSDSSTTETGKLPGREVFSVLEDGGKQGRGGAFPDPTIRLSFFLNQPMNINQATASDLELISGIGPRTAERIIAYRNEFGSFEDSRELKNIHGIGVKTSRKISEYVSFK